MGRENVFTEKPLRGGKEIRIPRVSTNMHGEIKNIAAHLGISVTDFLKVELLHIIGKHPEHYRQPMLD